MTSLQSVPIETITGEPASLADYAGRVLLVVNVASKCGLTPQYEGLEALYEKYRDQGLEVLGFPANDFLGQEPGTNDEILDFCTSTYAVQFPLFAKIEVTGPGKHPLYASLTEAAPHAQGDPESHRQRLREYDIPANEDPEILWNFEKFLVGRDGSVIARFAPNVTPDDPQLVAAIEAALAG
jgi:glutathione peroxidase